MRNNIDHSSKRGLPPFFHSDTNPVLGNALFHSAKKKKKHVLVVNKKTEEIE